MQSSQPMLTNVTESPLVSRQKHSPETLRKGQSRFHPFGTDGFTFSDLIDVVNPLHHIPVVGPIYRKITGDNIDSLPRITGSTLFGGPIGATVAVAETVLEAITGKDTGAHLIAMLKDGGAENNTDQLYTGPGQKNNIAPGVSINDWIKTEAIYQNSKQTKPRETAMAEMAERSETTSEFGILANPPSTDPVLTWARAEAAYRAGLATKYANIEGIRSEAFYDKWPSTKANNRDILSVPGLSSQPTNNVFRPNSVHQRLDLRADTPVPHSVPKEG